MLNDEGRQIVQEENQDVTPPAPKKDLPQGGSEKDTTISKFDEAFRQASQEVQDYILGEDFPKDIAIICRLQKLDEEKENVMIENVAISILLGLLSTSEAKSLLMESFKASGLTLEDLSANLILKDIEAYILSPIRRRILQGKIANKHKKEMKHLTLGEKKREEEKAELRKILLEKTGNINGRGDVFKYQDHLATQKKSPIQPETKKEKEGNLNRESLLSQINLNLKELSDEEKLKERMERIKQKERERIEQLQQMRKKEAAEKSAREKAQKIYRENLNQEERQTEGGLNQRNEKLVEVLTEKLKGEEKDNFSSELAEIIQEREREEEKKEERLRKSLAEQEEKKRANEDPYRESL